MAAVVGEHSVKRIAPDAARVMQEAIEGAGGGEVFFAGALDSGGCVTSVRVCARGNTGAVPALFEGLAVRDVVLHNHPSGELRPSEADLELAAMYSAHGHGVYIVDNDVTRVYVVIEPFLSSQTERLSVDELAEVFSPGGALARVTPHFEVRPQQKRMAECITRAFNEDGVAVVEAPTGVGKTFAYLLPAVLWAVRNKERVVVSTRTINLQEQIMFKDIPLLKKCLGLSFEASLVKGRGNYVCLRKLQRVASEATLFDDEATEAQLVHLSEWVKGTKDGSRSDLPFVPARDLWERICSESDTCAMGRCPMQKQCFVTRARREIAKADLLVVNHHMLFSDVSIKKETGDFSALAVLPSYRRIVFDEAHSIEDSATEYFGIAATRLGALATLGRLYRRERLHERGLLPFIRLKLVKECTQLPLKSFEAIQTHLDQNVMPAIANSRESLLLVFSVLRSLASEKCGQIGRDIKWRLTEEVLRDPDLRETHDVHVMPAVDDVRQLVRHCHRLQKMLEKVPAEPNSEEESPVLTEVIQLNAFANRLERMGNVLAEITSEELQENTVRWIELNARDENIIRLARCPLHVGKPLADWVYENLKTVVMTSATLTVQKKFDYLFDRLGVKLIPQTRVESLVLDSPFDFEKQAMLCIVQDLPEPTARDFLDATIGCIRQTLQITRGHAFLLFTSFFALDHAARALEDDLRDAGITPLRQGRATRTQLLEQFRSDLSSVLFATDSFWEGVDVAGKSLQCVILPKLPFRVPTEPIQQARAEAIEAKGGNAFREYSVPQAVIKFRQGFGRLIRRRSDRGVIVVLDRRIVTKYYGRAFLDSLPDIQLVRGRQETIVEALRGFFAPKEKG